MITWWLAVDSDARLRVSPTRTCLSSSSSSSRRRRRRRRARCSRPANRMLQSTSVDKIYERTILSRGRFQLLAGPVCLELCRSTPFSPRTVRPSVRPTADALITVHRSTRTYFVNCLTAASRFSIRIARNRSDASILPPQPPPDAAMRCRPRGRRRRRRVLLIAAACRAIPTPLRFGRTSSSSSSGPTRWM
jgi:hypothetical protein